MKKVLLWCLFFILLTAGIVKAEEPKFPAYSGFVNDYTGVLNSEEKNKLEDLCRKLEQATSAEMAVAVVNSVAPLDSKEYAVKLFEQWKIGKKGKDNGLLILLAMDEKRIEIEVGYGLEGVISDSKAGKILDDYAIPYFKQGKFGEGLYQTAAAAATEIAREASQEAIVPHPAPIKKGKTDWLLPTILIVIVLLVVLSLFTSGVAAGLMGAVFGAVFGLAFAGIIGAVIGAVIGFVISYLRGPFSGGFGGWGTGGGGEGWWGGFGDGEGGGGGFGGFGGGGSGGGGAGRSW